MLRDQVTPEFLAQAVFDDALRRIEAVQAWRTSKGEEPWDEDHLRNFFHACKDWTAASLVIYREG